jgi:WD40 repeat protein
VCNCCLVPRRAKLTHSTLPTASLELKATEEYAHDGWVMSVGYNSDGDKIVSGGEDGTIKVWDAGTLAHHIPHPAQN